MTPGVLGPKNNGVIIEQETPSPWCLNLLQNYLIGVSTATAGVQFSFDPFSIQIRIDKECIRRLVIGSRTGPSSDIVNSAGTDCERSARRRSDIGNIPVIVHVLKRETIREIS
jgi:hypothetical protein